MEPKEIARRALNGYFPKIAFIMGICMATGAIIGSAGLLEETIGIEPRDERNSPLIGLVYGIIGGGIAVGAYHVATVSVPLALWMWRTRNDE